MPDTLQCIGLQSVLTDYFSPVEITCFPTFDQFMASCNNIFDYYFTQSDLFMLNADFFLPRRSKTVILIQDNEPQNRQHHSNYIYTKGTQENIIDQLQQLFTLDNNNVEINKDLSMREIDVLQLIVRGSTNKEVADKLNISLNTVLSHRKNITAKLGIKTVSGLTFYAIMNGIISGDEIEFIPTNS